MGIYMYMYNMMYDYATCRPNYDMGIFYDMIYATYGYNIRYDTI